MKRKRGRKKFDRYLFLYKLAEVGEITCEGLLNAAFHMFIKPMFNQTIHGALNMDDPVRINIKDKVAWAAFLSRLKKENLVSPDERGKTISITSKGLDYIKNRPFCRPQMYESIKNKNKDAVILVIYDIPENKRKWRDWLRFQLVSFGYTMLQQSVWSGNNILSKDFINDLKRFELFPYVHVLSVNKKGTLSSWIEV